MKQSGCRTAPIGRSSRQSVNALESWRYAPAYSRRLRIRTGLLLLLSLATMGFFAFMRQPFHREDIRVVVLCPELKQSAQEHNSGESDLANLLSHASGQELKKVATALGIHFSKPGSGSALEKMTIDWSNEVNRSLHSETTLVVYLTGVLSMHADKVALCESSRDALYDGRSVPVVQVLDRLRQVACKRIILYVDALCPMDNGSQNIRGSLVMDELEDRLEQELTKPSQSPIAVFASLCVAGEQLPSGEAESRIAKHLKEIFTSEKFQVADLLREESQSLARSNELSHWLVTPDWRQPTEILRMPKSRAEETALDKVSSDQSPKDKKIAARLVSTSSNIQPEETDGLALDTNERENELPAGRTDVANWTDEQLLSKCWSALDQWEQSQPGALPSEPCYLGEPLSIQQRLPVTYRVLKDRLTNTQWAMQIAPHAAHRHSLEQLYSQLTLGQIPNKVSGQDHSHEKGSAGNESRISSLSLEATWFVNGLLQTSSGDSSCKLLNQLIEQVRTSSDARDIEKWVSSLPEATRHHAEFGYIEYWVAEKFVSWEIAKGIIVNRILCDRIACDPACQGGFAKRFTRIDQARDSLEKSIANRDDCATNQELSTKVAQLAREINELLQQMSLQSTAQCLWTIGLLDELAAHRWIVSSDASSHAHETRAKRIHALGHVQQLLDSEDVDCMQLMECISLLKDMANGKLQKPVPHHRVKADTDIEERLLQLTELWQMALPSSGSPASPSLESIFSSTSSKLRKQTGNFANQIQILDEYSRELETRISRLCKQISASNDSEWAETPSGYLVRTLSNDFRTLENHDRKSSAALKRLIDSNRNRLKALSFGTTRKELSLLEVLQEGWREASRLATGNHDVPSADLLNGFQFSTPEQLDLVRNAQCTVNIGVQRPKASESQVMVSASFDPKCVEVFLQSTPLPSQRSPAQKVLNNESHIQGASTGAVGMDTPNGSLTIRRVSHSLSDTPLVLYFQQEDICSRLVIPLQGNSYRLAEHDIHVRSNSGMEVDQTASNGNALNAYSLAGCELIAGQSTALRWELRNCNPVAATLSAQLWSCASSNEPPVGRVSKEAASMWLEQASGGEALAQSSPEIYQAGESRTLKFAPVVKAGEQKQDCKRLLLFVTDATENQSQILVCSPTVIHPAEYIDLSVTSDGVSRSITVAAQRKPTNAPQEYNSELQISLYPFTHDGQLQQGAAKAIQTAPIAQASLRCDGNGNLAIKSLSTAGCNTPKAWLKVTCDGWSDCFMYEVDVQNTQSWQVNENFAAIDVRALSGLAISTKESTLLAQVIGSRNGAISDRHDESIEIGLDLNGDRTLRGEDKVIVEGAHASRFRWDGVSPRGDALLTGQIVPHRLPIPVPRIGDQHMALIANYRSGTTAIARDEEVVVLDSTGPAIETVHVSHAEELVVGKPVILNVKANDFGMSGVAKVEAHWSLNGELEIQKDAKSVQAVAQGDNSWSIVMPTAELVPGTFPVLLRASDRVGNMGSVQSLPLKLWSEEQLIAWRASLTSVVQGDVYYGKVPQPGIKISLYRLPDKETDSPSNATPEQVRTSAQPQTTSKIDPPAFAETLSAADGSFIFGQVPSGNYTLKLSGIARGNRENREMKLTITAPQGVPRIHFRLDKQP